jgi:hypothetical protein
MKPAIFLAAGIACLCLASAAALAETQRPRPVLDVTQLPAAVRATLQREGARVSKVEQDSDAGRTFYEALLSRNGGNYSVFVGADGEMLMREIPADERKKSR